MGRDAPALPGGSSATMHIRDHRCYLEAQGLTDPTEPSQSEHLYNQIYEPYPQQIGKRTSRKERDAHGFASASLTYGEVEYGPFAGLFKVLERDGLAPEGKFADLGSGVGKAVFTAALAHDFAKVLGIEILSELHALCQEKLLPRFDVHLRERLEPPERQGVDIRFVRGDATVLDEWTTCDVVFANSTCFDKELMARFARMAANMAPGTYFVTMTAPLPSTCFELRWKGVMREAWGDGTVFVQRRVDDDAAAVRADAGAVSSS